MNQPVLNMWVNKNGTQITRVLHLTNARTVQLYFTIFLEI